MTPTNPVYCVDCRHLRAADTSHPTDAIRFARCALAPLGAGAEFLAEGMEEFNYCSTARKHGPCGPNASLFLKTHDATASAAVAAMDKLMNGDPQ